MTSEKGLAKPYAKPSKLTRELSRSSQNAGVPIFSNKISKATFSNNLVTFFLYSSCFWQMRGLCNNGVCSWAGVRIKQYEYLVNMLSGGVLWVPV